MGLSKKNKKDKNLTQRHYDRKVKYLIYNVVSSLCLCEETYFLDGYTLIP